MKKGGMVLVNGINGKTGKLLFDPIPVEEFGKMVLDGLIARREKELPMHKETGWLARLRKWAAMARYTLLAPYAIMAPFTPVTWHMPRLEEPAEAGWGVVIHKKDKRMEKVLEPLIKHRNGEILWYDGNEHVEAWIRKHILGRELPYYLMIAGPPEDISFEFQYMLDVRFAAGRLYLEDEKSYENYQREVIEQENGRSSPTEKRVVMCASDLGTQDPTCLSRRFMAEPLADLAEEQGYAVERLMESDASEENLKKAVCREKRPALVYTATHGIGVSPTDERQERLQGALCCQDSKEKDLLADVNAEGFLTGYDVDKGFDAHGSVWFSFACFGAGTPVYPLFHGWISGGPFPWKLAEKDFVAWLPMRLLGCEKPALSFIGHIDPAWVVSFMEPSEGYADSWTRRLEPFKDAVEWILRGVPVGHAMKTFSENCASLNSWLMHLIDEHMAKPVTGPGGSSAELINKDPYWLKSLADLWITKTDYQNYIVLGDPAVRVRI